MSPDPVLAVEERVSSPSRVLVVLVAHDGGPWLARTLTALADQTHEDLEVVAIDNGSTDDSRELMLDFLDADQLLIADRDLGFGAAVSMALDARPADVAPYVLLLHDDLELAPDAVARLAATLDADPRLAVAGPKLLDWDDPRRLQSVGWTVDVTGRPDSGIDEGELDQGQRDVDRRCLYVSTGGMLLRRDVFDELGRFDRRFHLFRDDLDLCWRAWMAGYDIEVVPSAVAQHAASATNYQRLGQTRFIGPRYFAERNTLATLLKNYGAARLLAVVPLYFLVGIAKVVGFLLTRRFGDAWQTLRAWLWNVLHLRDTWRLRRAAQRTRTRTDGEMRELFGRITPRVRAYAEAIADWIAGGDVVAAPEDADAGPPPEPETVTARVRAFVQRRPVLVTASVLGLLFAFAALPVLGPGLLRGGEFAPWPEHASAFLGDHVRPWHEAAGLGTSLSPSPAQAMLGLWHLVVLGSSYLAPRLLLLGLVAVAWVLALRAAQQYSDRRLPRIAAATAYVLSPPAIAAFATGSLSTLVAFAALPGIVAALATAIRRGASPERAWRGAAAAALLGTAAGAFVPVFLPILLLTGLTVMLVAGSRPDGMGQSGGLLARIGLATVGPLVLLLPWSLRLLDADGLLRGQAGETTTAPLWRWALQSPDVAGFPGILVGVGFLLAGALGLILGWRKQAVIVANLWGVAVSGIVLAWWAGGAGAAIWPGLPLVLSAAAFAGLLAVAFATAEAQLARHAFGWRQLAVAITGAAVAVSLATATLTLVRQPLDAYAVGRPPLPSFVTTTATAEDPFRVLVLAQEPGGEVSYEVVPGTGPTMAGYGVPEDPQAAAQVAGAVTDLLAGTDPSAATSLTRFGLRFVVVPAGGESDQLDDALRRQMGLEPRPVEAGRVLAITSALPRASVVSDGAARLLMTRGELPEGTRIEALTPQPDGTYAGSVSAPGTLLLTEIVDDGWEAMAAGRLLDPATAPTTAFSLRDAPAEVTLRHTGALRRGLTLGAQLLAVLLVISVLLRPPGLLRRTGAPPAETEDRPPQPLGRPPTEPIGTAPGGGGA